MSNTTTGGPRAPEKYDGWSLDQIHAEMRIVQQRLGTPAETEADFLEIRELSHKYINSIQPYSVPPGLRAKPAQACIVQST
jgi:hypothetical protein